MVTVTVSANLTGLCRALVTQGLLSAEEGESLQNQARSHGESFLAHLLRSRRFRSEQIAAFAAVTFGLPFFNLDALDPSVLPRGSVDAKLLARHRVLPIAQRGNRIYVALSDPSNLQALDDIKFQTGQLVEAVVVEDDKLGHWLEQFAEVTEDSILKTIETDDLKLEFSDEEAIDAATTAAAMDIDDAPVVRYLQKMMLDAVNSGVSDIHFEPYEKSYRIRYRLDGLLYEVAQPPLAIKEKIASRIKVISKLDISEKRVPQDGRMKLVLSRNKAIDFRVSTLPTLYGEKIVMRILDSASATMGIEKLGYEPEQLKLLTEAIVRPYGMVLVTGPTGSGKTVFAVFLPEHPEPAGREHFHRRRPGGNPVGRYQSGQRQRQGRPEFRRGHEGLPAPGPGHHHGRRDPRPRNRGHRHQGGADRPHGTLHLAHQRRAFDPDPPHQHGHPQLQRGGLRASHYRAAPGPAPVPQMPQAGGHPPGSAARRRLR